MSQGFIKLYREGGLELLEEDPKAFLLLTQISLRARRTDAKITRVPLNANQAFIGDHEKIGLSKQEYRNAKTRLSKYGLITFKSTNKGTIATLISTDVYDINAEDITSRVHSPNSSAKHQPTTHEEPANIQQGTNEKPLTRKEEGEEKKKATTLLQTGAATLYECLLECSDLTAEEKAPLMKYPEERVLMALEWASKSIIKTTLIRTLHWHCKQEIPPSAPEKRLSDQSDAQLAAWEYTNFLQKRGCTALATKNQEAIPQHFAHIISDGQETSISLKNSIDTVKADFATSMNEISSINRSTS